MSQYAALITAWNNKGSLPGGVTGAALTSGLATATALATLNAWTMSGASQPLIVPTYQIYNAIVPAEFRALSASSQAAVNTILGMGTVDASPNTQVRSVLLSTFVSGSGGGTRAAFTALAATFTPTVFWWAVDPTQGGGGFFAPVTLNDLTVNGLT